MQPLSVCWLARRCRHPWRGLLLTAAGVLSLVLLAADYHSRLRVMEQRPTAPPDTRHSDQCNNCSDDASVSRSNHFRHLTDADSSTPSQVNIPRETRQEQRRRLVKETCDSMELDDLMESVSTVKHTSTLFVDRQHQVLYCGIPKAALSSWKLALVQLNNPQRSFDNNEKRMVHDNNWLKNMGLSPINEFDDDVIAAMIKTYRKFIVVREPLERLLSAYRDKFQKENAWTKYFHSKFGTRIIRRYRRNPSSSSLLLGNDVRFDEFLAFVTDLRVPTSRRRNEHWETYQNLCHPCLVKYDYVIKFETFQEDTPYVLRQLYGVNDTTLAFPHKNMNVRPSGDVKRIFYANISRPLLSKVYAHYRLDFKIFGYTENKDFMK